VDGALTSLIGYLLAGFALSLALTPLCRTVATRLGYVARPKEDRWHRRPTALLGGVAIAASALSIGFFIRPLDPLWQVLLAAGLIAAVGLIDDLISIKPSTKLIAQIVAASMLLFFGYRLHWTYSQIIDAMLTLVWIVGITNGFNLLDNMDGLCAGIASIGGLFLVTAMVADGGVTPAALYLTGLVGATLGFLVYNVHPASIFMGDAGSLFLGFNLAALTLVARGQHDGRSSLLSVIAAPVLLLLIPIFDTTLVTALRLLSRRRPSQGGRDHASHRLVAIGLPERTAVLVLWALAAAGGLIALGLGRYDPSFASIAALGFVLAMMVFAVYLSRVRVYEESDLAILRSETLTPVVVDLTYKRRVFEVLLDLCLIPLAYYAAYRLRYEGALFGASYPSFQQSLPIVIALQLTSLFIVGGYRGVWRYFGMMDAVVFAKGVLMGTIASVIAVLYLYRFDNYSRAVFVIDAVLLLLMLSASRASFRLVGEFVLRRRAVGRRCLVYGTAGASLATIRDAFGADQPLRLLGFIDDDPRQQRARVQGYSVVGDFAVLLQMVEGGAVDCVVVNVPLVDVERLQRLEAACQEREVELLRLQVHLKPVSAAS